MFVYVWIHIYTHVYICIYVYMCTYVYIYKTFVCIYIYVSVYKYIFMYINTILPNVWLDVGVCMYWCIYMYIHIYTYIIISMHGVSQYSHLIDIGIQKPRCIQETVGIALVARLQHAYQSRWVFCNSTRPQRKNWQTTHTF